MREKRKRGTEKKDMQKDMDVGFSHRSCDPKDWFYIKSKLLSCDF